LLEGKNVNLRRAEKDDVSLVAQRFGDPQYMGEYQDTWTIPIEELRKSMLEDNIFFIIEKKDGTKIGHIGAHMYGWMRGRMMDLGFALVPGERRKGYGTEAIQMMVDYLFLETGVVRVQVPTGTKNISSQKALEKAGFTREGIMRKSWFAKGEYIDQCLYSILREEWKEPKVLAKTTS
jgi:RimJ/RimL family protein N-acetyltransferase